MSAASHHVVVLGGGFGGLNAALALARSPVRLTLVDRRNFHLFQPLLYQVATGGLSPADIASPLRTLLRRNPRARVLQDEAVDLDPERRRLVLRGGALDYDTLIVAAGAGHHYFGRDDWEPLAPGLKTIEDALRVRARVLGAFERAETAVDERELHRELTFVIVGAGPTGVELAGAIGELSRSTLLGEFRRFRSQDARVLLVEAGPRILPTFPESLARAAGRSLARLGVEVAVDTRVEALTPGNVTLRDATGEVRLEAATVLWAAGVRAAAFGGRIVERTGAAVDGAGRIRVGSDCTIAGRPEIFVIGDLARFETAAGDALPGVAQVAIQQGRYAARCIRARLDGRSIAPFRYRDLGSLAVIGRAAAVADFGRLRFAGYPAWLLWLFVHVMQLVEFENRVLVFVQWAFSYLTRKRGARLITTITRDAAPDG